jgi:hypothetical protein
MELDIQKGLQALYCYDTDNYGLDLPDDDDDDLSWVDDLEREEAA